MRKSKDAIIYVIVACFWLLILAAIWLMGPWLTCASAGSLIGVAKLYEWNESRKYWNED